MSSKSNEGTKETPSTKPSSPSTTSTSLSKEESMDDELKRLQLELNKLNIPLTQLWTHTYICYDKFTSVGTNINTRNAGGIRMRDTGGNDFYNYGVLSQISSAIKPKQRFKGSVSQSGGVQLTGITGIRTGKKNQENPR